MGTSISAEGVLLHFTELTPHGFGIQSVISILKDSQATTQAYTTTDPSASLTSESLPGVLDPLDRGIAEESYEDSCLSRKQDKVNTRPISLP